MLIIFRILQIGFWCYFMGWNAAKEEWGWFAFDLIFLLLALSNMWLSYTARRAQL